MTYNEFYKIIKNLDRNKYHTCCSVKTDLINCEWVIFRKDMPFDEYWSSNNKPVLDSKINNKKDLIDFVNKNSI